MFDQRRRRRQSMKLFSFSKAEPTTIRTIDDFATLFWTGGEGVFWAKRRFYVGAQRPTVDLPTQFAVLRFATESPRDVRTIPFLLVVRFRKTGTVSYVWMETPATPASRQKVPPQILRLLTMLVESENGPDYVKEEIHVASTVFANRAVAKAVELSSIDNITVLLPLADVELRCIEDDDST